LNNQQALPHNPEAEQTVLGSIVDVPEYMPEARRVLVPEDFYQTKNRILFQLMKDHDDAGKGLDYLSLSESPVIKRCGGPAYLSALADVLVNGARFRSAVEKVKRDGDRRAIIQAARLAEQQALNGAELPNITKTLLGSIDELQHCNRKEPNTRLLTLADIHQLEVELPPPVIDGLLDDRDSLLLTGPGGLGKSLTGLAVALAVAGGRRLFNRFDIPKARPVLLVQSENGTKATKARIRALLEASPDRTEQATTSEALKRITTTMRGNDCRLSGDLKNSGFQRELRRMLEQTGAGLLVLDPLISFHHCDENDNVSMRAVLDDLTSLASENGAAVLVVHHHGKSEHTGANQSRGATSIIDWARGVLTLNRQPHEHRLLIKVDHTKHGNFPKAKSFLLEVRGPAVYAVEPDILCPPSTVQQVLLDAGGTVASKNALVKLLQDHQEVSRKTAQDAIDRALGYGYLIADNDGKKTGYRLPE